MERLADTSGPVGGHGNYLGSSVDSANAHRRPRKIRRTGRHIAPSQVEKVAEKAGKAAPAMAIAGVLVAAAPQAHAAERTPAKATTVTEQQARTDALVERAQPAARTYTVRSGDTLSSIAERYYDNSGDWTWIYAANKSKIRNPNSVYMGESLTIPYSAPSGTSSYTPRHAKATARATVLTSAASKLSGNLGCSGLEALWEAAGGSQTEAFTAAEIAMAESGGRQDALSPTNDYGYWQINGSHGPAEATFNPIGNAKAAIAISDNGRDWDPWTTYVTGAYSGRC
jgi:LysM repeat protein